MDLRVFVEYDIWTTLELKICQTSREEIRRTNHGEAPPGAVVLKGIFSLRRFVVYGCSSMGHWYRTDGFCLWQSLIYHPVRCWRSWSVRNFWKQIATTVFDESWSVPRTFSAPSLPCLCKKPQQQRSILCTFCGNATTATVCDSLHASVASRCTWVMGFA